MVASDHEALTTGKAFGLITELDLTITNIRTMEQKRRYGSDRPRLVTEAEALDAEFVLHLFLFS